MFLWAPRCLMLDLSLPGERAWLSPRQRRWRRRPRRPRRRPAEVQELIQGRARAELELGRADCGDEAATLAVHVCVHVHVYAHDKREALRP